MPYVKNPIKRKKVKKYLNYVPPRSQDGTSKHLDFINRPDLPPDEARETVSILYGGYGSGKSYTAAFVILDALVSNPKYIGKTALCCGLSEKHNKNILLKAFKDILTSENKQGRKDGFILGRDYKIRLSPLEIELPLGSKIIFSTLEAKENLAGYNVSIAWADEIDKPVCTPEVWNEVQNRCSREGVPGFVIGTCNSKNRAHWIYQRYFRQYVEEGVKEPGVYLQNFTIYDNHFMKHKWQEFERQYGYSALETKRALMGEWVSMEGCVFNNFDPLEHTYDPSKDVKDRRISLDWAKYRGMDFGGVDPTACLWVAKRDDGSYFVYREYYKNGMAPEQHAPEVKRATFPGETIRQSFSDTHLETRLSYQQNGLFLTAAAKGEGSIEAGCNVIRNLLDSGRLHISRNCKNLINEMQTYEFDPRTGKPKDKSNHCIDALRYVLWEIEGKGNVVTISKSTYEKPLVVQEDPNLMLIGMGPNGQPQYVRFK